MYFLIYETKNLINNNIYIGAHQTEDLNDGYLGSGKHFQYAVQKYGEQNFVRKILFEFDNSQLMYEKEKEIVNDEFILRKDTYNIKLGGHGGWEQINKQKLNIYTDENGKVLNGFKGIENLKKSIPISDYLSNKKNYDYFVKQVKNGVQKQRSSSEFKNHWIGRRHSEKTKNLLRGHNKQSGERNSQFGTCWITNFECNKKIKKEEINNWEEQGWVLGRITNFQQVKKIITTYPNIKERCKSLKILLKNEKQLIAKKEKENLIEQKKKKCTEWYILYNDVGFNKFVEITNYNYSKPNLVTLFSKWVTEYKPQNGKKRGK